MNTLSENDLATLLLCSDLACGTGLKPYSDSTYEKFARALYRAGHQPSDLFKMPSSEILEITESNKELFKRVRAPDFSERIPLLIKRHTQLSIELASLEKRGIRVITRADKKHYPKKMLNKFSQSGIPLPAVIYYAGELSLANTTDTVAMVGSRDLSSDINAVKFTETFVEKAVQSGFAVSSGGAKGIDSIAEKACQNFGGESIITVSDSLSKKITDPYVRSALLKGSSVYLSLVNPMSRFTNYNAMARNKIIYALSEYAMVVTCSFVADKNGKPLASKGGTWVGAHECFKYGLSKLFVRMARDNTPKGNSYLIDELQCGVVSEEDVFSQLSFSEIFRNSSNSFHNSVSEAKQTDLFDNLQ